MTRKQGFTLIELMLVVIIIAALGAMVLPRLTGRAQQARISVAKTDVISNIASALDLYELDNGRYPSTSQGLEALLTKPSGTMNWNGPYIKKAPLDPWGNLYQYSYPGSAGKDYDLSSLGPNGVEGDDDISN
ncbi:MAG: type II secretion system major pseudopilin GspG [Candidatus Omnitrophica bacterium]|nr:type II secretion system major pseudopilin GspG [Candidatus Omnitrophota bacterium]